MRLFITEFITGGGIANDPLPESLKQEGQLMLQAVLNDCAKLEDIQLVTTRDARINIDVVNVEVHIVESAIDYMQQLVLIASQCDATWIIAPESEGILETMVSHLTEEKFTLINCDAQSVRLAADKLICTSHLKEHDILAVPNLSESEVGAYEESVIIKDRYGAGCERLMICDSGKQALEIINDYSEFVVQPYLDGVHLSLSMLFSSEQVSILTVNEQTFTIIDNQPKLKSCLVNAHSVNDKLIALADKLFKSLPGMKGYVGVDVIKHESEYYVVDVNPRLTSSYVGLSGILDVNPAELCVDSVLSPAVMQNFNVNKSIVEVHVA